MATNKAIAEVTDKAQPATAHDEQRKVTNVYEAISAVSYELSKIGISKKQESKDRNGNVTFKFRGIDDVMSALAPIITKYNLVILPKVTSREMIERKSNSGGALFVTILNIDYHFIYTPMPHADAAFVVSIVGEAMDSGDKGTNKALSVGFKMACLQAFCIPVEGADDPDAMVHDVAASEHTPAQKQAAVFATPADRKGFIDECVSAFAKAKTPIDLAASKNIFKPKFVAMEAGGDRFDQMALDEITAVYVATRDKLKAPAPKTVDKAIEELDDSIPF